MAQEVLSKQERKLKNAAKIGLPASMIPVVIKGLEAKRIENQQILNKAEEDLKAAEQMYLDAKQYHQSVKQEQEEFDRGYQALLAFQENPGAEMMFYSTQTETPAPTGRKERKFRWVDRTVDILQERQVPMRTEHVVNAIFSAFPEYKESLKEFNSTENAAKYRIIKSLERAAQIVNRSRGKQELFLYKGKMSLIGWIDLKTMQPKAEFMKAFMYTENTVVTANGGDVPETLLVTT